MMSDTTVVALRQPDEVEDPLTAVLRSGARRLLASSIGLACRGQAARGPSSRAAAFVES